jgi:hypothetical protein
LDSNKETAPCVFALLLERSGQEWIGDIIYPDISMIDASRYDINNSWFEKRVDAIWDEEI